MEPIFVILARVLDRTRIQHIFRRTVRSGSSRRSLSPLFSVKMCCERPLEVLSYVIGSVDCSIQFQTVPGPRCVFLQRPTGPSSASTSVPLELIEDILLLVMYTRKGEKHWVLLVDAFGAFYSSCYLSLSVLYISFVLCTNSWQSTGRNFKTSVSSNWNEGK